uniref:Uncharacterized protein n=1 Tax=Cyprinus carpio TaxID=7962 RepID=A0A8C2G2M3_CYPCA
MCHIPVFCWISATVLEKMLRETERGEIPKTLTQMYTHFLIIQTNIKHEKDYEKTVKDDDMILKLGKIAFQQLVKGNLIFYEQDLRECGIDVTEASVYSGLCTQIFKEEFGLFQGKVYCFVHLSIQEHLAALYVHLSFTNNNLNVFDDIPKQRPRFKLHQRAVDEALQSKNGHLDLFLRFLLGLSVESNYVLLQSLMKQTLSSSTSNNKTAEYIKKKISTSHSPEKSINLFHCLNELGDHSLVEKVQDYVKSGTLSDAKFSSSQWSAVVFLLLTSETKLDEFYLKKFVGRRSKSENVKVLQKLLPVVKESRSVQLCDCDIADEGCAALASALRSDSSQVRELNLSDIKLGDSGVKQLSAGLENLHCKLEILWLRNCGVTDKGCAALASALSLNPSHLRKLDLSMNELGNSGENLLSGFTIDLHLSDNKLGNSGVEQLSAALKNPHCKLQKLKLTNCGVRNKGLAALTSALASNPSHLRNLNLSENKLQNSGVELLSDVLENPHCKLEILCVRSFMQPVNSLIFLYRLRRCNVTDAGCDDLASALLSNPSHLRQLNLSWNKLGNAGVKLLSDVLKNPQCKLESLRLINCGVTDEGCVALASALGSNTSHLRELDLSDNRLGDSVKLLSALKDDPYYKLDRLNCYCEYISYNYYIQYLTPPPTHTHTQ